MTEEQKCENCKYYDTQEKCCLCRNKSWYEPNDEIKIAELEKENAELKEINSETLAQLNLDNGELIIQLTKAKEIIKQLLDSCYGYNSKTVNYEVKAKAEAFLKE